MILVAGAALFPQAARSQTSNAGGEGLFDVRTATVPARGTVHLGFTGSRYVVHPEDEVFIRSDRSVWDMGLSVSGGVLGWLEVFGRADAIFYSFEDNTPISPADGLLGAKALLPWGGKWIEACALGSLNLPWGNRARGYSSDAFDPEVSALITVPLPESNLYTAARVHFNLGYHFFGDELGKTFEDQPGYFLEPVYPRGQNDRIDMRTAVEFSSKKLTLFAELLLDDLRHEDIAWKENPLFLTPGMRLHFTENMSALLGAKVALATDDPSSTRYPPPEQLYPDWQIVFGFTYSWLGPEDTDRDGDGIPDFRDRCPTQAEDRDSFEDDDGCPDLDNDRDGVKDAFDARPDEPEDFDGYQDSDGVFDIDNDGDGIADIYDKCPNEGEDFDGVADVDGCPETDADNDGVSDMADKCPEEAEVRNGIDDEDGCPDKVATSRTGVLRGVVWDGAELAPTKVSFVRLKEIAEQVKSTPGLGFEIKVHPNPAIGDPAQMQQLAAKRADYLRGYFKDAGVNVSRIVVSSGTGIDPSLLNPGETIVGTSIGEIIPLSASGSR
jgi:hypothetical protein